MDPHYGVTFSGFCLTSLPHRKIPTDQVWEREGDLISLAVEPGFLKIKGKQTLFGVPFGSRARMILLHLQTQAIRTQNQEVELGRSLHDWMERMGIPTGGKSRNLIVEQANRLSACHLTFYYPDASRNGTRRKRGTIIDGGFAFSAAVDDDQGRLWEDKVCLSDKFYEQLVRHPVPVLEPALRAISNKSHALDIYIWLAFTLPALQRASVIDWASLRKQFGGGYAANQPTRLFRRHFLESFQEALAVYPDANVSIEEHGLRLQPSRSPVESAIFPVRLPEVSMT
jgi:hypothetical protein